MGRCAAGDVACATASCSCDTVAAKRGTKHSGAGNGCSGLRPPRPVHIGLYELHLTPLELIDRIAALVPPPRTHRHRYFGVLAPNSPLRAAVTALATPAQAAPVLGASISTGECAPGVVPMSSALPSQSEPVLPKRAAHYLWAVLIARIYEVFPLLCPLCGGHMRIIAFITHSADIRHILDHIGADSEPPRISPARGPPLWDDCSDAQMDDEAQTEPPDWDLAAQPAPDFEVDQRISW